MRILGFSKKWPKLQQESFTTFRYPRKDSDKGRDWHETEIVKIVYHPRQEGEVLGIAQIISKIPTEIGGITDSEAVADGFPDGWREMANWLAQAHKGQQDLGQPINKLTLKWIEGDFAHPFKLESK